MEVDEDGNRLLDAGVWSSSTTLDEQGGQLMHFAVTNQNALGVSLTITADTGETHSTIIPPVTTVDLNFSIFGNEPRHWTFTIDTESDAFVVSWKLYSTWIPGDPPNP